MAQGSSTVPPPPTGDPKVDVQAAGNGSGLDRVRSIINRLSGGGTPAIQKALDQHHAQVVADAQRHADTAKRYYGMVAQARITGKNPMTGQPATPEEMTQWQQMADGAWADYGKIAGKAKAAKPIIQQMGGLLQHIAGGGKGQQGAGTQPPQPPQPQAKQGDQTVSPPPQGGAPSSQQPTVPPPPGSNPLQESAQTETQGGLIKEQDAARIKDEEYRNKLLADADPRYHVNEIKQFRGDIQQAFPKMASEDVQKAVLSKMGVTAKAGTGKEMQPDFKDGMLIGVKDPATNEYYTDPKTMPPAAKAIYDSAKKVEAEHDNKEEAKEQRRLQVQEKMAALHEQIHNREQELTQSTKIPPAEAVRASQAEIIKEQTADLREQLKDPELQKYIGPTAGLAGFATRRYSKKVQDFFASQESLDALLPLLHGYRGGAQTHKTFKDAMGSLTIDPKAYEGTLDALDKMSDNVVNEVTTEYPNAPMFKNKRGGAAAAASPRGKTVSSPPDGKPKKIVVSAEDMK